MTPRIFGTLCAALALAALALSTRLPAQVRNERAAATAAVPFWVGPAISGSWYDPAEVPTQRRDWPRILDPTA
jgi:hypothetical protein